MSFKDQPNGFEYITFKMNTIDVSKAKEIAQIFK